VPWLLDQPALAHRARAALLGAFFAALATYAAWPWLPVPGRAAPARTIVVYGFSILGEVIGESVFPAFARRWQAETGERVELVSSFAGSGTITNQVLLGVPAEVVLLSLELDAMRLAAAGVVPEGSWRRLPHGGVLNRTPCVILVREGNPERIEDFQDLARPGVQVVHPDPQVSGAASWAIVAEHVAATRARPDDPDAGRKLLLGIWRNVVTQAASARAARTQFDNGFGDALVTYEQDVLRDRRGGRLRGEIVYPCTTVLAEHVVAVIDSRIPPADRALVDAFVAFLWSEEAQRLFTDAGFRSVDEASGPAPAFAAIADPVRIEDLGGWQVAQRDVVDGVWRARVLPELGR
jgi:sulfate transport system substrate-binding protein